MAARYLVSGGTGNWNSTTNWSLTSGGASGASFPTSTEDVIIDTASANAPLTLNVAGSCLSFVCSGTYAGTLTITSNLTVYGGNITLIGTMTISGAGLLQPIVGGGTMTSNGVLWTGGINIQTTWTLGDNWIISGPYSTANTTVLNGAFNMSVGGNLTTAHGHTGTASFVLNGTGTVTLSNTGYFQNNLTINTASTITFAAAVNYFATKTLTYTAGTVITTGSTLSISTSGTLNCASITWNNISIVGASTITLSAALNLTGLLTCALATVFTGAVNITTGGLTATGAISGTASIIFGGTGTWSGVGVVSNNITINTAGTLTLSGVIASGTGTMLYTAGTVSAGTSDYRPTASCTINTSGMTWATVTFAGTSQTYTLTSNLNTSVNTAFAGTTATTVNGFTINSSGGVNNGSTTISGTTNILMNGTGTWNGSGTLKNNLTINTSGTITLLVGTLLYNTGTLTYTAGTVITTGNTLRVDLATTFNTNGISWNNISVQSASTQTVNSLLTVLGTLTDSVTTSWLGTAGFTCGTFTSITAGSIITFKAGNTYTITSSKITTGTAASPIILTSNTVGSVAYLTLNYGATQDNGYCNALNIDSSGGQTIWSRKGIFNDYGYSYSSGNRTATITATTDVAATVGDITKLLNGTQATDYYWTNAVAVLNKYIKFDFGSSTLVSGFQWVQSAITGLNTNGFWKLEGSNDDISYNTLVSSLELGNYGTRVSGSITVVEFENQTAYRYLKFTGLSGTTSNAPWLYEILFGYKTTVNWRLLTPPGTISYSS